MNDNEVKRTSERVKAVVDKINDEHAKINEGLEQDNEAHKKAFTLLAAFVSSGSINMHPSQDNAWAFKYMRTMYQEFLKMAQDDFRPLDDHKTS